MSDLSSRAEQLAAIQRAQLLDFVDGFKRECVNEPRIEFKSVELRKPVEGDELIIAISFNVDGVPRVAAVEHHLPDPISDYFEFGMHCAVQLKASLGPEYIMHHPV